MDAGDDARFRASALRAPDGNYRANRTLKARLAHIRSIGSWQRQLVAAIGWLTTHGRSPPPYVPNGGLILTIVQFR